MGSLVTRSDFFDNLFKDFTPGFYIKPLHGDPLPDPAKIKVDVKESDKAYTVHAEIPGVNRDDIKVTIDGGMVTISAEVKQIDAQTSDEKPLREERYFGTVSRSFRLVSDVDESAATAKYDTGVLTLTLPKKKPATGRQLKID